MFDHPDPLFAALKFNNFRIHFFLNPNPRPVPFKSMKNPQDPWHWWGGFCLVVLCDRIGMIIGAHVAPPVASHGEGHLQRSNGHMWGVLNRKPSVWSLLWDPPWNSWMLIYTLCWVIYKFYGHKLSEFLVKKLCDRRGQAITSCKKIFQRGKFL